MLSELADFFGKIYLNREFKVLCSSEEFDKNAYQATKEVAFHIRLFDIQVKEFLKNEKWCGLKPIFTTLKNCTYETRKKEEESEERFLSAGKRLHEVVHVLATTETCTS